MDPKTFGKMFYGRVREEQDNLEGVCPVKCDIKLAQHFAKIKHGVRSVMLWGRFASLKPRLCPLLNGNVNSAKPFNVVKLKGLCNSQPNLFHRNGVTAAAVPNGETSSLLGFGGNCFFT